MIKIRIPSDQLAVASGLLFIASAVIYAFSAWYWVTNVKHSPNRVFWASIDQALSTNGVTTTVQTDSDSQKFRQDTLLRTGAELQAKSIVYVEGTEGSIVRSETLGTVTSNYIRYRELEGTSGSINSDIKDKWAIIDESEAPAGRLLIDGLESTIIMVGNLPREKRISLVQKLQTTQAIKLQSRTASGKVVEGRKVDVYQVTIDPVKYFEVLKDFLNYMGLPEAAEEINVNQAGTQLIVAEFAVNVPSQQFVKFGIPTLDATNAMKFSNWGAQTPFDVPQTLLSYKELQNNLVKQK